MLFIERCTTPYERRGRMHPISCLERADVSGYRSVYMFCEEDARTIKARGSSVGFSEFSVFSDCLFIDIDVRSDEEDDVAVSQIEALKAMGLHFELYTSGNRSYHLHIPHPLKRGFSLPYTHSKVVEGLGITCDHSLYRPNSLFRLSGTLHKKTARRKVLIGIYGDKTLDFPLLEEEKFIRVRPKRKLAEGEETSIAVRTIFRKFYEFVAQTGDVENRYLTMYKLIYPIAPFISFETALEIALLLNKGIDNPNEHSEVVRAVQGAYK